MQGDWEHGLIGVASTIYFRQVEPPYGPSNGPGYRNNHTISVGFDKEAAFMPTIRSSTVLRNNYNQTSTLCHEGKEPVFITKNGQGDLAVMSIETYERLTRQLEIYQVVVQGMVAIKEGRRLPREEDFQAIMRGLAENLRDQVI